MEIWDAYYADKTLANKTLIRGEKIPHGLFHIIVETLVQHKDGTYLVMQRDYNKSSNPGLYEGSAGGSVLSGESAVKGALREVKEETGITPTSVAPIYEFIYEKEGAITLGFITIVDCKKECIKYQKGETIAHKWLTLAELKMFVDSKEYNQSHAKRLKTYLNTL
ncbi:MAG TPA: NUDIX hydrolase [Bacilli bacterium]|nr:NUDIX hydrolase [Bacilli bacterium]